MAPKDDPTAQNSRPTEAHRHDGAAPGSGGASVGRSGGSGSEANAGGTDATAESTGRIDALAEAREGADAAAKTAKRTDAAAGSGLPVGRRRFLKAGAVTAAVIVTATRPGLAKTYRVSPEDGSKIDGPFMDAVQRAADGDTIEVDAGTYTVGSLSNNGKALDVVGGDIVLQITEGGTVLDLHGRNWTFDGFGFDYGNTSSPPAVRVGGAGWTFANTVFWNTKLPSSSTDSKGAVVYPTVPDGATGTIRNCYLHDGAVDPDGYADYKAMWAGGDNIEGTLVMDGLWCEEWAENTLYVSNNSGRVESHNCYFRNTNVSGPRETDAALSVNCTFVLDGKPPKQFRNGQQGSRSVRGVWWNAEKGYYGGDVTIKNCDFVWKETAASWANNPVDASDGDGGALIIEDTNFRNETGATTINSDGHDLRTSNNTHGSADGTPPIPAPPKYGTTPNPESDADSGSGSDSDSDSGGNTAPTVDRVSLSEVETDDANAEFDASWQVSDANGDLNAVELTLVDADDGETESETGVEVAGETASGTTRLVATGDNGSGHTYRVEVTVRDSAGQTATDASTTTEAEEQRVEDVWRDDEKNELVFLSTREEISEYRMRVLGTVRPGSNADMDDGTDSLSNPNEDEYVVDGLVGGSGQDNWWATGHVDSLTVEPGIDIFVNGTRFSAEEIEGVGTPPEDDSIDNWRDGEFNHVDLSRNETDTRRYDVVVAGEVRPGPKADLADGSDKLILTGENEYTIRGGVNGGTDDWEIDGKVTDATFEDGITMRVNRTEYPPSTLEGTGTPPDRTTSLPNTVIVDGTGSSASYEFTASGTLVFSTAEGATVNRADAIDGSTVRGRVKGDVDAYAFSGDVVDLVLDGDARLVIDDVA